MPKQLIKLDYDQEYDFVHDFIEEERMAIFFEITGSKVVYIFKMCYQGEHNNFSVDTIGQADLRLEFTIAQGDRTGSGILIYSGQNTAFEVHSRYEARVKLTFRRPAAMAQSLKAVQQVAEPLTRKQEFGAIDADIRTFIERGPKVTLVGNDGTVTVPKRLLKLRSEALEMIFNNDSQEKQTNTIELKDFDSKTLDAFASFLMNKEIKDGIETATGLILLGDKYNIQAMKSAAEDFVKRNIKAVDQENVINVLSLVNMESLKQAVVSAWSNGY